METGSFRLRIPAELKRMIFDEAQAHGLSAGTLILNAVQQYMSEQFGCGMGPDCGRCSLRSWPPSAKDSSAGGSDPAPS